MRRNGWNASSFKLVKTLLIHYCSFQGSTYVEVLPDYFALCSPLIKLLLRKIYWLGLPYIEDIITQPPIYRAME